MEKQLYSRRNFLREAGGFLLSTTVFSSLLAGCNPEPTRPKVEFVTELCKDLGREIDAWKLASGVQMADRFPEVRKAADLLSGKIDPRVYLPFLSVPIACSTEADPDTYGKFSIDVKFDPTDSRRIKAISPNKDFKQVMLKSGLMATIDLSKDVNSTSLRLPVAAKEASQLVDILDYCRAYVSILEKGGARFSLENPNNIPTTREEIVATIALSQMVSELSETGYSWFLDFVDWGSHLRVGGIVFANWYIDMLNKGIRPTGKAVDKGLQIAGFLQAKGLIQEEKNGFIWKAGRPPSIHSEEFLQLFLELSGRK